MNATTPALHPFAPVVAAITIPADAFYVGDVISIGGDAVYNGTWRIIGVEPTTLRILPVQS